MKMVLCRSIFTGLFVFSFANLALSASIQKCDVSAKTCDVKLEEGRVGDNVSVLNERAQPVGIGTITAKDKNRGTIKLDKVFRDIKRGYPVVVNLEHRTKQKKWGTNI